MTATGLITLVVVVAMMVALIAEVMETDVVVFSALGILLVCGILTPKEAFEGFSNKGMLTIAVLFIVAHAAQMSGFMESFFDRVMGRGDRLPNSLIKMMIPLMSVSAFINNTPLVAMFTPYVREWALRHKYPPSKFLIPLTYAVSFGGLFTLIGTSTNLVVNGLLQQTAHASLGMFELGWVGVPCGLAATIFMISYGHGLLPDNADLTHEISTSGREYLLEMRVQSSSILVGKRVEEAGLRNLENLFLVEIVRNGEGIAPVKPNDMIMADDRLIFTGIVDAIVHLQKIPGLVPYHETDFYCEMRTNGQGRLVKAVVSPSSPMLGKTIKEGNFRSRYDAAVLAVHRHGERMVTKIGSIVLKPGDTLLLLAGDSFFKIWSQSRDFYLINKISDIHILDKKKSVITFTALFLMVALSAIGIMDILVTAVMATIILLVSRCLTAAEARRALDLNVLIVIASSFGISRALEKTGVASFFAEKIVSACGPLGPAAILAAIFLVTTVITEGITNNAAAALVFPVAMAAAGRLAMDPKPFAIAVAVAASASFVTTIGYQTNMMVSGPGRYKAMDFVRVGIPVKVIYAIVAIPVITALWRVY
jgi:di/tricarboxylate transporter